MGERASFLVHGSIALVVAAFTIAACGSDAGSGFDDGSGASSSGASSSGASGQLGGTSGFHPDAGPASSDCKPRTCADQGIECGPAGDGCGGLITDCGKCDSGKRCGGPNALSKCVSPTVGTGCVAKTCAELGVECGLAGDGCGGVLTCPQCPADKQCGAIGKPSQCVPIVPLESDGGACVPKTKAEYNAENKNCGTQSDGCGGTVDLGTCTAPEFCGGGGPSKCAISGGGACTKKTCTDYPGKCGPQPDDCGGVTADCGTCTLPEVCGGGGTPSVCGGGTLGNGDGGACTPTAVCGANSCGKIADGCGGVMDCGQSNCTNGKICGGAGTANQCGAPACTPITTCPAGMTCGSVADGCGGTVTCGTGTCTLPQICGATLPNVCGGGGVVTDAGVPCIPSTDCTGKCGPIADGCGGINACANNCVSPNICGGGNVANQCGGGNQCTPKTVADCTAAGFTCGFIADGCGGFVTCGVGAGACPNGGICGGNAPNVCTNGNCAGGNFCNNVSACSGATQHKTRVTGVVYAPNGTLPIPGATVYVPNGSTNAPYGITAINAGVSDTGPCDTCSQTVSGSPLASTTSNFDGSFTLDGVPNGVAFPLVIQLGKWRGVVQIPSMAACATYNADGGGGRVLVRLPKTQGERDTTAVKIDNIPLVAISTGNYDGLECVFRKIGIDDSQFGNPTGFTGAGGRIRFYQDNDFDLPTGNDPKGGAVYNGSTPRTDAALTDDPNHLNQYDAVVFGCAGGPNARSATIRNRVKHYADIGGRVFATHYEYVYLNNTTDWSGTVGWDTGNERYTTGTGGVTTTPGTGGYWDADVNAGTVGSKRETFAKWLNVPAVNALQVVGPPEEVRLTEARNNADQPVTAGAEEWLTRHLDTGNKAVLHYTFNTPWGNAPAAQCGRVLFSDFHVSVTGNLTNGQTFPNECSGTFTNQEKILAFFLFDLTSCINTTTCVKKTCANYPANTCGQQSDGCGGLTLNCGNCTQTNQTCGGGGTQNQCGGPSCTKKTCPASANCGSVPDGCGSTVACGTCATGTCGGGGTANVCGTPSCTPRDCPAQGIECGQTGDGCGNVVTCAPCPAGTTCGGGGVPNKCGHPQCTPATACPQGKNCGDWPDGCGGSVHCGDCQPGQTCGGGGTPNVCGQGSCTPKDCAAQGAECGSISNQCGGVATCPACPAGDFCNGQNLCVPPACVPKTCVQLGVECGPTADTCGGLIPDCGTCPAGTACGAGGVPGKCGVNPCTPQSCSQLSAVCGQVADGCGALTPDCGTCQGAQSCKNGACVIACTPRTCAEAGAQCGAIADGCGSIVDCGPCPPGLECGFNNQANICGSGGPK